MKAKKILKIVALVLFFVTWAAALFGILWVNRFEDKYEEYKKNNDNYLVIEIPEAERLVAVCHSKRFFGGSVKLYALNSENEQIYIGELHESYKEAPADMNYKAVNNGNGTFYISWSSNNSKGAKTFYIPG